MSKIVYQFNSLKISNDSTDVSTNLKVNGHSLLSDLSASKLDVSQNLKVGENLTVNENIGSDTVTTSLISTYNLATTNLTSESVSITGFMQFSGGNFSIPNIVSTSSSPLTELNNRFKDSAPLNGTTVYMYNSSTNQVTQYVYFGSQWFIMAIGGIAS